MKVSIVNSAGDSSCWNYATDTDTFYSNYAGDNVCCIYADFEVVLSVIVMLVDLCVAIMQLEVSAANMRVTIFIVIMQIGTSLGIMHLVFSALHFVYHLLYCNYASDCFCRSQSCK